MKKPLLTTENVLNLVILALIVCAPCYADLQSSLEGIKSKLTLIILPALAVIGIGCAAISLFTGNPNAKQHMLYSVLGCVFGFGAQAIVDFISQTIR